MFNQLLLSTLVLTLFQGCYQSSKDDNLPDFFKSHSNVEVFSKAVDPSTNFSFTKEQVFGDTEKTYVSNRDRIEVDDLGRVYMESQKSVHVYESNGDKKGIIGREGRGPGEFVVIHNMQSKNGMLYVYDANQSRISVFDTETFELEREIFVPSINDIRGTGEFSVVNNDYLIVGVIENIRSAESAVTQRFMHYYLMDHSGNVVEPAITITDIDDYYEIVNQRGRSYPTVPFDRTTLFSLFESGKIYLLWTGQVAIKVLDIKGNFLNGIYYPYSNVKVQGDSDFPVYYETLRFSIPDVRRTLGERLPETRPAVFDFIVDDEERIWVATITEDVDKYEWWVLQKDGELINKFEWLREEKIEAVKNGYMYTRRMEEETGSYQVVRYRIEMS
ncbi:MAG: 6-bladed beta-propeller [Balneolaceae bacterium]|nr:MAG: 6-bladed beta-propeller [Balneolaceae bacterium]